MYRLIKKLSDMRGISGFEYRFSDKLVRLVEPLCDEVRMDALGNVIAVKKCGKRNAPKIMLEAHMDEIGLMVSGIDDEGFISFVNIGGVDQRILPSLEVMVHGKKNIRGVIGAKPPHLQTADEYKQSIDIPDMSIDTGLSADEVKKIVSVGDAITLNQSVGKLLGKNISLKTMDDRAGVATLITVLEKLKGKKLHHDVYVVIAVQEEVGLRGAKVAAYGICPDVAVAVDVCHGITPDNSREAFETGKGVVISVGPNIHPLLGKSLINIAKEQEISYDVAAEEGHTGTDAWVMQVARGGIPTGLLSIPLKYMHTSVETMSLDDAASCADLLYQFVLSYNKEDYKCF